MIVNDIAKKLEKEKRLRYRQSPALSGGIFFAICALLEQFQLLSWRIGALRFPTIEQLYFAKLLVRDTKNSYLTMFWKHCLYPTNVYLGIFYTGAMAYVYGELKHSKTILY